MTNGTWELTYVPSKEHNNISYKWVVCIKRDALGELFRYKAWLVAKGYS